MSTVHAMFKFIFDSNEKQIGKLNTIVTRINNFENDFEKLSNEEILEKTNGWKKKLKSLSFEEQALYLNEILPEAFALVREVTKRVQGIRLHDVQLMAGIVLHQGKIAEQKTGEGKTNTATLPIYLNALTGMGVHLITPNDYLSRHGAGWMGRIYSVLGISVGVIMDEKGYVYDTTFENDAFEDVYATHLKESPKQQVYSCDVVYGTNHQFGFDYLRDNMVDTLQDMVQTNPNGDFGSHTFAIVDEVDSILIDFARTPLIISTRDAKPSERYHEANKIVKSLLKDTDYDVDEKFRNSTLTDLGIRKVERLLGIQNMYEDDFEMVHLIEQALSANSLYEKDRDYIIKDGKVVIIDQFTGRQLPSNRFSHGLHQALEAKEGVQIQEESKTVAEISYQNYFRKYKKLAGMTGTALTEAEEFFKIYKLDVVAIPTHSKLIRKDNNDMVYKTESAKFKAVVDEIETYHKTGRPVLVGTTSVEKSERLHDALKRRGIVHEVLNAKNHEREALIIAQAGRKSAVTISTNMAGRGVDIILGGDPATPEEQSEVRQLGGLHVLGTERHESRRVDNQLRGRAGRQGDPGSSRFFVSLQDELMRIFGGEQVSKLMDRFGIDESVPLEAGLVTRSIESAQKRVEGLNFDRRKRTVEYDDVMNIHRDTIYKLRRRILEIGSGITEHKDWFIQKLVEYGNYDSSSWDHKEKEFGHNLWGQIVLSASLPVVNILWMEHLSDMDQIQEGIGLRGYAQRDPIIEYKKEGHERFSILVSRVYSTIVERLNSVSATPTHTPTVGGRNSLLDRRLNYQHAEIESGVSDEAVEYSQGNRNAPVYVDKAGRELKVEKVVSGKDKVGRNDPCFCGSGKKYKNCHGKA